MALGWPGPAAGCHPGLPSLSVVELPSVTISDAAAADLAAGLTDLVTVLIRLRPRDISLSAEAVLSNLERLGPQRVVDLVAVAGVAQPTMTELVSRLERDGLVARVPDPEDGRAVRVVLTDDGRVQQARRRAESDRRVAEILRLLPTGDADALLRATDALASICRLGSEVLDTGPLEMARPAL